MGRAWRGALPAAVAATALASVRCSLLVDTSTLGDSAGTGSQDSGAPDGDPPLDPGSDGGSLEDASTPIDGAKNDGAEKVFPDGATVWPENGHAYLVVTSETPLSWSEASSVAVARGGHLVTISSAQENEFVFSLVLARPDAFKGYYGPWIGAIQRVDGVEPDGGWSWVTGEPWSFSAWKAGEPNESNEGEDFANFYSSTTPKGSTWSDVTDKTNEVVAYIIEFE